MKNGITVISVSVMVVVIIILLGTVTVSSYYSIQNAKKTTFSLEISNIQEKVDRYMKMAKEDDYPILTTTYTISLTSVSDYSIKQFEGEALDSNNQITLYELDLAAINIEDNQFGNKNTEKDVYVLSKQTNKVYYLEGIKLNDTTYYTLTEELIGIDERNDKKIAVETYTAPVIESDSIFTVKNISETEKEIYLNNIKVVGDDITVFKYELGIIEENIANEYFKNNGKNILGDRLKLSEEVDITLYAENKKGNFVIKHIHIQH